MKLKPSYRDNQLLVFGALSFQSYTDNTITVNLNNSATQSLSHDDIKELLSWLHYFSERCYNNPSQLGGPIGQYYPQEQPAQAQY